MPEKRNAGEDKLQPVMPTAAATPPPSVPAAKGIDPAASLKKLADLQLERVTKLPDGTDDDEYQYVLRCTRGCVGIFLVGGHPNNRVLGNDDWVSNYHAAGERWSHDIYCQVCSDKAMREGGADDILVQLPEINYVRSSIKEGTKFIAPTQWLFRFPKDPELFRKIGMHRATLMANKVMNDGLPEEVVARLRRENARG